jgi:hypothetical protein
MKLLALYLLTCPHRTIEGLFVLPKPYICADLKWLPESLGEPFASLCLDGFTDYDEKDQVCLIGKALHYQPPRNPNMVKAAVRRIQMVPKTRLDLAFIEAAIAYCPSLAESLAESLPLRFANHCANHRGNLSSSSSSSQLNSALSAGGREASPKAPPARAPIKDGTMTLCPDCLTAVTRDELGEHCPQCEWRMVVVA